MLTNARLLNETNKDILGNLTVQEKESRFEHDALSSTSLNIPFKGLFPDMLLRFDNPVVISQRMNEQALTINNLPDIIKKDGFPDKAYGYS